MNKPETNVYSPFKNISNCRLAIASSRDFKSKKPNANELNNLQIKYMEMRIDDWFIEKYGFKDMIHVFFFNVKNQESKEKMKSLLGKWFFREIKQTKICFSENVKYLISEFKKKIISLYFCKSRTI